MNRIRTSLMLSVLLLAQAGAADASTTWYVDGVNGRDSEPCTSATTACKTIGHAIALAAAGDSVMVAAATYTENLTIGIGLELIGSAASTVIIDGGGTATAVTISSPSAHVTLSGLTIRNGSATSGGGISNAGVLTLAYCNVTGNHVTEGGGGIYNGGGSVTINHSTISGNTASTGARIAFQYGGGIWNFQGTMAINSSTISGNSAWHPSGNTNDIAYGAGIANSGGSLTVSNSTISGNKAPFLFASSYGGGISSGGTLTISNTTISGNSALFGSGISASATLYNTIFADNGIYIGGTFHAANCHGTMSSKGYNLSSDNTCNFSATGDLNNTDPKLGTLGSYGGPTETIPLLSGSPAIDAGNPGGCTDSQDVLLKTDQRGLPRPDPEDKGGCDMGAYESQTD